MSSKPKKAGKKVTSKATPKATPKTAPSSSKMAVAVDGVDLARLRRLARAGFEGADRCALLGIKLDVGLRAKSWAYPKLVEASFEVGPVCALALAVIESGVPPEALELAAEKLRGQGDQ